LSASALSEIEFISHAQPVRSSQDAATDRAVVIRDVLTASTIEAVQLSPDGKWVVFQMHKPLLEQNQYAFELWLADTSGAVPPRQLTPSALSSSERERLLPTWSPNSRAISYVSLKIGRNTTD